MKIIFCDECHWISSAPACLHSMQDKYICYGWRAGWEVLRLSLRKLGVTRHRVGMFLVLKLAIGGAVLFLARWADAIAVVQRRIQK